MADYLTMVTDKTIEKGRHRQSWLPREDRLCSHCNTGVVKTQLPFLTEFPKYQNIRTEFIPKFSSILPDFQSRSPEEKLPSLLGEQQEVIRVAAKYVCACHSLRDSQDGTHQ